MSLAPEQSSSRDEDPGTDDTQVTASSRFSERGLPDGPRVHGHAYDDGEQLEIPPERNSPLASIEFIGDRESFERELRKLEEKSADTESDLRALGKLIEDSTGKFQKPNNLLTRILERYFDVKFERPPKGKRFIDQERFIRQAKPYILPAKSDHPPMVYFGGINSTAYNWKQYATIQHLKTGAHTEVYSLKGHEGRWRNFFDIKHQDWEEDIIEKLVAVREKTGKLPIPSAQSTGAIKLAKAIQTYAERTGGKRLCAGVILSAPPVGLKRTSHRISLSILDRMERKDPDSLLWRHMSAKTDYQKVFEDNSRDELKNMSTTYIPVKALLELWRAIPEATEALKELDIPVLIVQGKSRDHLVAWKAVRSVYRKMKSEDKQLELWDDATHTTMFGDTKKLFWEVAGKWIADRREKFEKINAEEVERDKLREARRDIYSQIQGRIEQLQQDAEKETPIIQAPIKPKTPSESDEREAG